MAYDEHLAERIDRVLADKKVPYESKKMMGGLCYMVDDKMCVGIIKNNLMARVGPDMYENVLKESGCTPMDFTGKPLIGYVYISPEAIDRSDELEKWIDLCLDFNPMAKSSKKKKRKTS